MGALTSKRENETQISEFDIFQTRDTTRRLFLRTMSRKGSWDDDGSSLSESLLRFVHGGDEANPPTPRSVTQALALTPATRDRRNSDLDELTFYYSPEEPGVRGEVRVGLDRSVDRYDEDDDEDALVNGGGASFASWRDVPRRLEEVEGNVEDVRRRLLALELHGRRRAREDSANVAVRLPDPTAPADPAARELPPILSTADVALYRKIFALQKTGRWPAA